MKCKNCNNFGCSYRNSFEKCFYQDDYLDEDFNWQSFRTEAAKDILSNALIPHALQQFDEVTVYDEDVVRIDFWIDKAVEWSDKLISKLKEKEEK